MQCTRVPLAAIKSARQPGPDFFEPRIGSTGVDAQPWEPSKAARLIPTPGTFKSAPYAGPVYRKRRSLASVTPTDSTFGVGRHRALPEVGQSTAQVVPTYRRRCPMNKFFGALIMSIALTSSSYAGLFDRMLGNGCGCCCEPSCSCCEKSCCAEQSCGCEKSCGCENSCCNSCCSGGGCCILDKLCGCFHGCGCGESHSSCGCNGGASEKKDEAPKAPAEAGASVKPVAPRPMADPNASVGQQRNVVRTSFLR